MTDDYPEDCVWLELPAPTNQGHGDSIAAHVNNALRRLNGNLPLVSMISYDHPHFYYGSGMGGARLVDRGLWLNLEHIGAPLA